jgi:hypothetical protein
MSGQEGAPAGWYADPLGRAPLRWWDGRGWSDRLADQSGRTWADPSWIHAAPPPPPGIGAPTPSAGRGGRWHATPLVVASLVLCFPIGLLLVWTHPAWSRRSRWAISALVAVVAVAAMAGGGEEPEQVATVAPSTSTVEATLPVRPTEAAPETTATTTTASTTTTTEPPTTTTTTAPPTTAPPTTAPPTTVAPPAPTAPPTTVAPQPLAGGGCHPSYVPCVPFASDVDCSSGSGNGPAYTGRVEVIGPDVYDLDRDGDGIGCEDG